MNKTKSPPQSPQPTEPLNIYTAKLTFRKIRNGTKVVSVQIRYSKKGRSKKERLPFPGDINDNDLYWTKYRGEHISVYHRIDNNHKYLDMQNTIIHTSLAQKLERLVREVYFKNPAEEKI